MVYLRLFASYCHEETYSIGGSDVYCNSTDKLRQDSLELAFYTHIQEYYPNEYGSGMVQAKMTYLLHPITKDQGRFEF